MKLLNTLSFVCRNNNNQKYKLEIITSKKIVTATPLYVIEKLTLEIFVNILRIEGVEPSPID